MVQLINGITLLVWLYSSASTIPLARCYLTLKTLHKYIDIYIYTYTFGIPCIRVTCYILCDVRLYFFIVINFFVGFIACNNLLMIVIDRLLSVNVGNILYLCTYIISDLAAFSKFSIKNWTWKSCTRISPSCTVFYCYFF